MAMAAAAVIGSGVWYLLRRLRPGGVGLLEAVWQRTGELPYVKTVITATTEMVIVGLGAALGREGAPKDAAGALAAKLADLTHLSPSERRLLVACGAGAGLAAVYNVPLGGALFALEVLLGTLSLPLVLPALAASAIATAVGWIGLPDHPVYRVAAVKVSASEAVFAACAGILAGVLGVAYVRMIAWAKLRRPSGVALFPSMIVVFVALGATALVYPSLLGNGLPLAQLTFTGSVGVGALAVLWILRPLFTGACLRSGALGGLLTPTLCYGALVGGLAGAGWEHVWPGAAVGMCAVIGAAAMLSAAMQAPLTAVVLLIELTGRVDSLLVPGLLAVAGASLVARMLDDRSIYTAPMRLGRSDGELRVRPAGAGDLPVLAGWLAGSARLSSYRALPAEFRDLIAGQAGRAQNGDASADAPADARGAVVLVAEDMGGNLEGVAVIRPGSGGPEPRSPGSGGPGSGGGGSGYSVPAIRLVVWEQSSADPARIAAALLVAALEYLAAMGAGRDSILVSVARRDRGAREALEQAGWSMSESRWRIALGLIPGELSYRYQA